VPYAIEFCNPAPDADINSVGQRNFDWVVEEAANMAIERALAHKEDADNLTWGTYMSQAVAGKIVSPRTATKRKKATKATAK